MSGDWMKLALTALIISLILIPSFVSAFSITPASTKLNPAGSYPQSFEFGVLNSENTFMNVDVTVDGNLKDYITIDSFDKNIPLGGTGKVRFTVNLPKGIEPGSYESKINVVSKDITPAGGMSVKLAIAHVVWFELPFQGKHVKTNLMLRTFPNDVLDILAQAVSDGTENVTGAEITATVYSPSGTELKTFTGKEDVNVGSSAIVNGQITIKEPEPGEYRAVMTVNYDGKTSTGEKTIVLAAAAPQQTAGPIEKVATSGTAIVEAAQDNTLVYVLVVVVLILVAYIILKRR